MATNSIRPTSGTSRKPLATTVAATPTSTSAVPSLKRLSPSMIAASRCGTRTLRKASSTLTVSVMARRAPRSSATGNGRPIAQVATAAVARSDMATPGTASARIGRAAWRRLAASADSAPSKIRIGRNTISTTPGSIGVSGSTLSSTSSRPTTTSATLYGTLIRRATIATPEPTARTVSSCSRYSRMDGRRLKTTHRRRHYM